MSNSSTGYDTAQICMNGHVVTSSFHDMPEFNKKFCDKCGQATITECPSCQTEIQGHYRGSMSVKKSRAPAFCSGCGTPYPWTAASIEAAKVLRRRATSTLTKNGSWHRASKTSWQIRRRRNSRPSESDVY